MKILYVVPYVPNPIRVRPYQLIRSLATRGNTVTVATLWTDDFDKEALSQLGQQNIKVIAEHLPKTRSLVNCLAGLPSADPLQSFYCWQPALANILRTSAAQYDVIHIEHMRGARFGTTLMRQLPQRPPLLWDSVDSITHLFSQSARRSRSAVTRWLTGFELRRSRRYEGRVAAEFDRVLVTSRQDQEAFLRLLPVEAQGRVHVLPNGVDLEYFYVSPDTVRDPARLVVSGKMSYHANVAMVLALVEEILPRIWQDRPDVTLTVVGKDPPERIRSLAKDPRITITGYVADIRPYLQQAAAAVAPLAYGAGIQNKVLEAMACGTPVITTARAAGALTAQPGRDFVLADGPEAFAQAVLDLLNSPERQESLRLCGRAYVESHHAWDRMAALLEAHYDEEIIRKRGRIRQVEGK